MTDKRNFGLDIVRATAITLVFANHLIGNFITNLLGPFWYFAHLGVDIFFALSGFLIGSILIKMAEDAGGKLSLKGAFIFLCRRWFRTIPLYYFVLLIVFLLERYLYHSIESFNWKYLFWLQYMYGDKTSFFGESWSLCIEEWFYFTFSLGFCVFSSALRKTRLHLRHKLLIFTICYIVLFTLIRYIYSDHDYLTFRLTIFRLDSIAYGVFFAIIHYYYAKDFLKHKRLLTVASLALIFLGIWFFLKNYYINFYYTFTGIGLANMVYIMSLTFKGKVKGLNGVSFISRISYSIYLLNLNVILLILFIWGDYNRWVLIPSAIIITLVFSIFTYKYIEDFFLRLRNSLIKSDKKALNEVLPHTLNVHRK